MNTENTFSLSQEELTLKKHIMGFMALVDSAVRLMAAYEQLEAGSQNMTLWMSIREEEAIFSRLLFYLFRFNINATACELKEMVRMIAEIIQDCSSLATGECFSSLRQSFLHRATNEESRII